MNDPDRMIQRQEVLHDAMVHLNRCGNNIKLVAAAAKAEDQDSLSMHATDAMTNLVQMCDMYGIAVLPMLFKKLSQLDRIEEA